MSEVELVIGRLPEEFDGKVEAAARTLGLGDFAPWRLCQDSVATISLMNLASVSLFLKHAAQLEGLAGATQAVQLRRTRFRNLPYWETSIWLPVSFQPPAPEKPMIEEDGYSVFLGSAQGLLSDINVMKDLSRMDLGHTPQGYDRMRGDYAAFVRSDFCLEDNPSIVQWVWKGLCDGASLAVQKAAPMCGAG